MEKPRRAAKPGAKKAPTAAAKPRTRTARPKPTKPETPPPAERTPTRSKRARFSPPVTASVLLALIPAVALVVFLLVPRDDPPQQIRPGVPAVVTADELASFASSRKAPVYWAGRVPSRKLELTTTKTGVFVRYLPLSAPSGDSNTALTIATYPLRDAHATATRRAAGPRMAKRSLPGGGLAVWSQAQPTSIYLAYRGVPQLVEVYAPTRAEASRFALSGRVQPVS